MRTQRRLDPFNPYSRLKENKLSPKNNRSRERERGRERGEGGRERGEGERERERRGREGERERERRGREGERERERERGERRWRRRPSDGGASIKTQIKLQQTTPSMHSGAKAARSGAALIRTRVSVLNSDLAVLALIRQRGEHQEPEGRSLNPLQGSEGF